MKYSPYSRSERRAVCKASLCTAFSSSLVSNAQGSILDFSAIGDGLAVGVKLGLGAAELAACCSDDWQPASATVNTQSEKALEKIRITIADCIRRVFSIHRRGRTNLLGGFVPGVYAHTRLRPLRFAR